MCQLYQKSDSVLLEKIGQGDAPSFNELYKRHWRFVYTQAYTRLCDHSKAEDITQEIFCKIWVKRTDLSINNLQAYLYTAVRNKVLNLFEKEKRFVSVENLLTKTFATENADGKALQEEFLAAYRALVESLPSKRKVIFLQYYEQGRSTEEIADLLGISQKTVQNQLGRATTFLKAGLSHLLVMAVIILI